MTQKILYLEGMINWAKVHSPDTKYDVYTLDLYLNEDSWEKFAESGLQLKEREGEEGRYIKLRRPTTKRVKGEVIDIGPPAVLLENAKGDYVPLTALVGNGSQGICKIRVYETSKGPGHELVAVAVTDLVEYAGIEGDGEFPF